MPGDDDPPVWELRRLLARLSDIDVVTRLRDEGCAGPAWAVVRVRLAAVCVGALHKLLLAGKMNERTQRLGRPTGLSPMELQELRDDRDQRSEIVGDAVLKGLELLRKEGILGGGWEPDRASLRTYAVNACLLQICGPVRAWRRRRPVPVHSRGVGADIEQDPAFVEAVPDPSDVVIERQDATDPFDLLPEDCPDWLRRAIRLRVRSDGDMLWKDIARAVGVSERSLEGALRRLRQRIRTNNGEERP